MKQKQIGTKKKWVDQDRIQNHHHADHLKCRGHNQNVLKIQKKVVIIRQKENLQNIAAVLPLIHLPVDINRHRVTKRSIINVILDLRQEIESVDDLPVHFPAPHQIVVQAAHQEDYVIKNHQHHMLIKYVQ